MKSVKTKHLVQLISEHVPLSFNVGLILPFPSLHLWCSWQKRPSKNKVMSLTFAVLFISAIVLFYCRLGEKCFVTALTLLWFLSFFTEHILLMQSQTKAMAFILHSSFFRESRIPLVLLHLGLGKANFFSCFIQLKPCMVHINGSFLWTWSSWQMRCGTCFSWLQINPGTCIILEGN